MVEVSLLCPFCGRLNEIPGAITPGTVPKEDDLSVCWRCRQVAVVHGNRLCIPTVDERAEIDADERMRDVLAAIELYARPSDAIAAARRRLHKEDDDAGNEP